MDLRLRAAHKRPLTGAAALEESDSGESERSQDSQDDIWLPTPAASGADSVEDGSSGARSVSDVPESTSSTSESGGPSRVLAASPNKVEFSSWEAFDQYLAAYLAQTFQVFRSRSNTTVSERNERIRKQHSKAPPISESWVQYSRTFICTHAGSYKSQASKRPRQETRAKGCQAKINACVQLVDSANQTFAVRITRCRLEHNHRLYENSFRAHSSKRVALTDGAIQTVDVLRRYGAKKTGILRFITDKYNSNPNSQDVHNLVRKLKAREIKDGSSSSEKRLKKWMKEFGDKPGNVGRIFLDDINKKKVATCITLQTRHMRLLYEQFPEVLLIDATHGTNRSKHKVFSFMAHDTFGKGQFIQHALLQNEQYATLLTALEEFKSNNPAWSRLQCVLVDKDFTELSVLKEASTGVTVLLCQFHVLKYMREEIASADYGFYKTQKEQLGGVVSLLVYAKTEAEYEKHFKYMVHLASIGFSAATSTDVASSDAQPAVERSRAAVVGSESGGVESESGAVGSTVGSASASDVEHPFVAYFRRSWDNCRGQWCAYKRQNTVTLGNNTNNRLEASWKQLKEWVDSFMAVDECIASIMYYQTLQEKLFLSEIYKTVVVHHPEYDSEMSLVANIVSEHACELIHMQYSYALGPAAYIFYEGCPGVYFVKSVCEDDDALDEFNAEYCVTKRDWSCSCLFMSTRLLPCRHVFFLRKALGQETIIPTLLLNKRWLVSNIRSALENSTSSSAENEPSSFEVQTVLPGRERPWDSNRKFREALPIASEICDTMAGLGMTQYRQAMQYLQEVVGRLKDGKFEDPIRETNQLELSQTSGQLSDIMVPLTQLYCTTHAPETAVGRKPHQPLLTGHAHSTSGNELLTDLVSEPEGVGLFNEPSGVSPQSGQSGAVESESERPHDSGQSVPVGSESGISRTLPTATEETTFVIASPPRSRGRPKQSAKAKKAARKKAVAVAQEDSELHSLNLSLASVETALSGEATYASAAAVLNKFKVIEYGTKFKAPTVRTIASLPPTKPIIPPASITRILRPEQISICNQKVTAFQSKHKGTAEKDLVVDIPGFGVYLTSTMRTMKSWHTAMKTINQVGKMTKWVNTVDFSLPMPSSFRVQEQPDVTTKAKAIPVSSRNAAILDLVGKTCLSEDTMNIVMAKLFGSRSDVIIVDPSIIGSVEGEAMPGIAAVFADVFASVTNEKIFIPVCCSKNHWCGISLDLEMAEAAVYDPMGSTYALKVRALTEALLVQLPDYSPRKFRVRPYHTDLGVQVDSYNCGIYVLVTFEEIAGAKGLCMLSRKELQYLRYRYICMCA